MAASKRNRARRLALQALYQMQIAGHTREELLAEYRQKPEYRNCDQAYFATLVERVDELRAELDADIGRFGNIPAEQLDPVERAVIWIALAELRHENDVPLRVILNEAIEIARAYGAEGGHKFVNGLLDKAAATLREAG